MYVALSTTSTVNMCHREEMYVALGTTSTVNMSQRRDVCCLEYNFDCKYVTEKRCMLP